jgi:signal transduction histidine kinase
MAALYCQSRTKIQWCGATALADLTFRPWRPVSPNMDSELPSEMMPTAQELATLRRRVLLGEQLLALFRQAMGHDMPNHLVALQGLVRLLEMDEKDRLSPAGQDYLRRLTAIQQRVEALVRMLSDICRAGRNQQPPERLSLGEVAQEVSVEINQLFAGRMIEYHFPKSPFFLTAVRPDLHRVLVQLLRNAVQACPEGLPARLEIGAREAPGLREFWIADHGRGLATEQRQQLEDFLAGRQLKNPTHGLGLVLVSRIIEGWDGTLQIESRLGSGTTVTISLPATREPCSP